MGRQQAFWRPTDPQSLLQKLRWSLHFKFLLCGLESRRGQGFLVRFGVRTGDNGKEMSPLSASMWRYVVEKIFFFFSFSQLVQENKGLEMTALRLNSVTDVFCLAHSGFLENSEPTFKNWVISHKYLNFGMASQFTGIPVHTPVGQRPPVPL